MPPLPVLYFMSKSRKAKKRKSLTMYLLIALTIAWALPDLKEVYDYQHTAASIVMLLNPAKNAGGTGFELNYGNKQFTVTNAHVCQAGVKEGYMIARSRYLPDTELKILQISDKTDLCLLEPLSGLPKLNLRFGNFKKDTSIEVWGHPHLRPLEISHGKVTDPDHKVQVFLDYILTKKDRKECSKPKNKIEHDFMFDVCTEVVKAQQTNAHIEPGNSGSPVLDSNGRVGGVAFAADYDGTIAEIIPWSSLYLFLMDYTHELVGLE